MNRWLKIMLITCLSVFFSVNKLIAQEIWENVIEQLFMNGEENSSQLQNMMEELSEWKDAQRKGVDDGARYGQTNRPLFKMVHNFPTT